MSQASAVTVAMVASASSSERVATSLASARTPSAPTSKMRSCVVCRSRKVRCDKQSPCSNCRRANIACIVPSTDRPPKWARRLTNNAAARNTRAPQDANPRDDNIVDRLQSLEKLVKELSGQLEQAHAVASLVGDGSSDYISPRRSTQDHDAEHQRDKSPATNTSSVQKQFGRLVLQDTSRSRYVSSGFWSRVNDEVSRLVAVTPSS